MDAVALAIVVLAAILVVLHVETCRRFLLRREDPRTMALFRIACGLCTVGWTLELWPLADYLFSDEGLFATDVARQVFASGTFAGVGDGSSAGEPEGFFDFAAVIHFVGSPRQSILFFWDTPAAVRVHLGALAIAASLLTVGFGTRLAKWATLLLFHSLLMRNSVAAAGEQVFANFLLLLCLSRCGEAYSLDARRSRAPLRAIPAWPRVLALLQTIPLFTANGLAKSGEMWAAGDTFHYMLLHPHFHRFDPSALAVLFSENLFRVMTWTVHAFEVLFPLAIVGVALRFRRRSGIAAQVGARSLAARLGWIGLAISTGLCASLAYEGRERETLPYVALVAGSVAVGVLAIAWPWLRPVKIAGRVIDLDWVGRWPLGRRVWVTLLLAFTGTLFAFTSLGWFVPLSMATAILFFDGHEIDRALGRLRGQAPSESAVDVHERAGDEPALSERALAVGVLAPFATAVIAGTAGVTVWNVGLVAIGVGLALVARSARPFLVGWFCAFHVAAVTLVLLPRADPASAWRETVEAPLRRWLDHAHAIQTWRMFAPNGQRTIISLETEVTLADGTVEAIGTGVPQAWSGPLTLGRDKAEKTTRRVAATEGAQWYTKWHGRYVCRTWALEHGGTPPAHVALIRGRKPIPSPREYARVDLDELRARTEGWREPIWEASCANEVEGQLSPELAARHGVPAGDDFRPWPKPRALEWHEKRERGEVPELPWPLAILGAPALVVALRRRRLA